MTDKRKAAVFTIVRDEKMFLPIWLRYYRRHFEEQDIYILDNDSKDGCVDGLPNVRNVHSDLAFDHGWLCQIVQNFYSELLNSYDIVVFAEVDEIISAPWHPEGLKGYISDMQGNGFACIGYNVFHDPKVEPEPIDLSRPILEQRSRWIRDGIYDKTLVTRVPRTYSPGFHHATPNAAQDPKLVMVHLHRFDLDQAYLRNEERSKWKWHDDVTVRKMSYDNNTYSREEFETHYFGRFASAGVEIIPDDVRKNVII